MREFIGSIFALIAAAIYILTYPASVAMGVFTSYGFYTAGSSFWVVLGGFFLGAFKVAVVGLAVAIILFIIGALIKGEFGKGK